METLHLDNPKVGAEISDTLKRALENGGSAYAEFSLPFPQLAALHQEANSIRPGFPKRNPIRRKIIQWKNTERATFVPPTMDLLRHPIEVGALSDFWVPQASRLSRGLTSHVRRAGKTMGLITLAHWAPNRIGFNYMHGSETAPAVIPEHTDVHGELGMVIAFDISGGKNPGRLNFILGHDTCKMAGIVQPPHSVEASCERIGMTIAQLDRSAQAF